MAESSADSSKREFVNAVAELLGDVPDRDRSDLPWVCQHHVDVADTYAECAANFSDISQRATATGRPSNGVLTVVVDNDVMVHLLHNAGCLVWRSDDDANSVRRLTARLMCSRENPTDAELAAITMERVRQAAECLAVAVHSGVVYVHEYQLMMLYNVNYCPDGPDDMHLRDANDADNLKVAHATVGLNPQAVCALRVKEAGEHKRQQQETGLHYKSSYNYMNANANIGRRDLLKAEAKAMDDQRRREQEAREAKRRQLQHGHDRVAEAKRLGQQTRDARAKQEADAAKRRDRPASGGSFADLVNTSCLGRRGRKRQPGNTLKVPPKKTKTKHDTGDMKEQATFPLGLV